MSKDKVFNIGVMIGNVHTQHPMELIRGINEAAKTENVNISYFIGAQGNALDFWNGDENDLSSYNYQYNSLYDYSLIAGLDAIIISYGTLCIFLDQEDRETFAAKFRSVPLVILEEYDEDSVDSFIISDNYESMHTIMEHLLTDHGYKKVVYLSGPKNNTDSNERERAYLTAMKENGLTVTNDMVEYGDYSSEVDDVVERLLDNNPDAQAIVSANDEMAVSVYRVLQKRGLTPGKDIAVTGYDDVDFAQRMDPPLTTANQDGLDMGYRALKCAVSLCTDPTPVKLKLPARFLRRQSCGCEADRNAEGMGLTELLNKIEYSQDTVNIEKVINEAVDYSYESVASIEAKDRGKEFFEFLMDFLYKILVRRSGVEEKALTEEALLQVQKLCTGKESDNIDYSGFLRSFHQVMNYYMNKTADPDKLLQMSHILEITDTYITSYIMRSKEDSIVMLLNNNWIAPASIKYMIDKADDENAFNRLALETVVDQGAKSAYLYLLPEPLKCDRKENFTCPEKMELVAEYLGDSVKVYEKNERTLITKEKGFVSRFPDSEKHNYVVFLLFAKNYQYGLMLCEIDIESIGVLYGVALQISTAKAYMEISKQENEAKQQLYNTLRELEDKNKVLSFISSTDDLTGLYNRRGFIERAVNQVNANIGSTAAIFFSDLDHLKQINDEFGHQGGDFALKTVGTILKETMEPYSGEEVICGRTGGDEFISFIICKNETDVDEIMNTLKERCREFNENCDEPFYVEFSTGCVTFKCEENYSIADLTNEADKCLYEAKKKRRASVIK